MSPADAASNVAQSAAAIDMDPNAERVYTRRQAAYIEAASLLQDVYGLRGIFP
ncbi:MAG: hypothetical protein ACI9C1_000150 [Candidatus Aldehydirespiratoraceae bacterium]|jgi:hypothetical protein